MPLNDTYIKNLKPAEKAQKHFDGGGLFLFVPTSGSKLWRMAYRFNGKSKLLSFGDYPTVTLKEARERRDDAKRLLAQGEDPAEHKRQIKMARLWAENESFRQIACEWHQTRLADFTDKHRGTVMYRLEKYIFPQIGRVHIAKRETPDILAVVKPIEQRGNFETSRRLLQIIGQVFRYAVATGRAKHDITADMKGALRPRKVTHRAAVLSPEEVGRLLQNIDEYQGYYPLVCALKLAPHVFTRPTELRCAQWSEVDFDKEEWRIPAGLTAKKRVGETTNMLDIVTSMQLAHKVIRV